MTYQTITVHLASGPRAGQCIALAALLGKTFGGTLSGIAPTGVPDLLLDLNAGSLDAAELAALSAAQLRRRAEMVARAFDDQCKALEVAFRSRVVEEEPVDAMVRLGRCSDLIVVEQTDRSRPADGVAFDFPQQVLLHAGPPVLVVPHSGAFGSIGRNILVAWKDTREAARAVRSALPLLRAAGRVTLLELREPPASPSQDDSFGPVRDWLASHGIDCDARREVDLVGAGDHLLSRAADIGADLIVSGGYGHSRLREWVLGGVTRHLLQHMTVPTLFAH